jgi:hypothetical protein
MTCREARRLFFLYFDSELEPQAVQEVNSHLEGCTECRSRWAHETVLEEAIRRVALAGDDGGFPWERLEHRLAAAPLAKARRRRRIFLLAGAAATLAFALLFLQPWRPPSGIAAVAYTAAEHHERYVTGKSPLHVHGAAREAVRAFYSGELGFEVLVPERVTSDGGGTFELRGARRCTFLGGPVAYVGFGDGARDVTVVLGPLKPPALVLETVSDSPGGRAFESLGRCRVLVSTVHGRLFVATGEVSEGELEAFLETFRRTSAASG